MIFTNDVLFVKVIVSVILLVVACMIKKLSTLHVYVYRLQSKLIFQKKGNCNVKGGNIENHENYINELIRRIEIAFCKLQFILIVLAPMFVHVFAILVEIL